MTSRIFLITLSLGLAAAPAVLAGEAPEEVKTAGYHLKNRSSFTASPEVRAPFWPIGWTPASKVTTQTNAAPVIDISIKPEQFNVTSILLGSQSLAVINGRTYAEGEFIRAPKSPRSTDPTALPQAGKVRVVRIVDGMVTLQAGSQAVNVPLKRPQLMEKRSNDEDLLSSVGEG